MKNIIIIFTMIALFSCSSDESTGLNFDAGVHLDVQAAKDYLPAELFNESTIVYVNERNEELRMSTNFSESSIVRTHNGREYKADKFNVNMFNPDDIDQIIFLRGNTNLTTDGKDVILSLSAQLGQINVEHGNIVHNIRFKNNQPILPDVPVINGGFEESVSFLNREFKDVFLRNSILPELGRTDGFSELNLNSENGVVSFRDENNELWVFDRIEE